MTHDLRLLQYYKLHFSIYDKRCLFSYRTAKYLCRILHFDVHLAFKDFLIRILAMKLENIFEKVWKKYCNMINPKS